MVNFTKKTVIDLLLGKYEGDEENEFLALCFSTEENAEEYESIREDLMESYLRNELSAENRERFENHFLKDPQQRQFFEFAVTLRAGLKESVYSTGEQLAGSEKKHPSQTSWLVPTVAFGVLIVAGILAWQFVWRDTNRDRAVLKPTPTPTPISSPTPENPGINAPGPKTPPANAPVSPTPSEPRNRSTINPVLAYSLSLMSKGGGARTLEINKDIRIVALRTTRPKKGFPLDHAEIEDEKGTRLFQSDAKEFTTKGADIIVFVPAEKFKSGKLRFVFFGKDANGNSTELKGTERFFPVKKNDY